MTFIEFYVQHRGCEALVDGIERLPNGQSLVWIGCRHCDARVEKRTAQGLAWAVERARM